jgi:hypothetical protein
MPSNSFWSDVCANARGKPLQTLLGALYASHSVLVRFRCVPPAAACCLTIKLLFRCSVCCLLCFVMTPRVAQQIATYGLSALAAGAMFYMWRRLDKQDRQRVWPLYGWFSGLMLCGSCIGAVTWAVAITTRFNFLSGNHAISNGNIIQASSSFALSSSWGVTGVLSSP